MPTKGHMVVPWEENIHLTPFHTIKRAQVWLEHAYSHKMSGTEKKGDRQFMLSKTQLEAIAEAAGIEFIESGPLANASSSPNKVVWQVKAEVEGTDGKKKRITRTYPLDMRLKSMGDDVDGGYILLARQRARKRYEDLLSHPNWDKYSSEPALDDEEGWEKYIEAKAMADWTMTYRHMESRAETGAELRIIRTKCRIRNTYHESEFSQPWIVYRAEFDMTRALQSGGPMAEVALRGMSAAMTRALGIPETMVAGLLENINVQGNGEGIVEQDMLNASDKEINELEKAMSAVGFKSRAACDSRSTDIFGLPLSQLTKRHVRLMHEYIKIGSDSSKVEMEDEERQEFVNHLYAVMELAFAEGSSIEDLIEERWWNAIYAQEEQGQEEEPGEESAEEPEGESGEEEAQEELEGEETAEEGEPETEEEDSEEEEE